MANDLLDKMPARLKSVWDIENEPRSAARNGLILRKDEASAHLAEARRHLEKAMNEGRELSQPTGRRRVCARKQSLVPAQFA